MGREPTSRRRLAEPRATRADWVREGDERRAPARPLGSTPKRERDPDLAASDRLVEERLGPALRLGALPRSELLLRVDGFRPDELPFRVVVDDGLVVRGPFPLWVGPPRRVDPLVRLEALELLRLRFGPFERGGLALLRVGERLGLALRFGALLRLDELRLDELRLDELRLDGLRFGDALLRLRDELLRVLLRGWAREPRVREEDVREELLRDALLRERLLEEALLRERLLELRLLLDALLRDDRLLEALLRLGDLRLDDPERACSSASSSSAIS